MIDMIRKINLSIVLCAFTIMLQAKELKYPVSEIPAISWWSIGYLVLFGSVLTFIAFIYALQNLPAEISSNYSYINPIIAVVLGAIIFGEDLNAAIVIGGFVILSGLYMINYSLRKKRQNTM